MNHAGTTRRVPEPHKWMILLFLGRSSNQGAILSTIKFIKQINLSTWEAYLRKDCFTLLTKMYKTALGLRGEVEWQGRRCPEEWTKSLWDSKVKCGDPHWVPIWGADSEEASEWVDWVDTTSSSGDQRVRVRPGKWSRAALNARAPPALPVLRKVLSLSLISKRKLVSEPTHPGVSQKRSEKVGKQVFGEAFLKSLWTYS